MAKANSQPRRQGGGNRTHPAGGSPGRNDKEAHYLNNGLVLRVTSGDITQLSADAVVAGEDSHFSGDGGVATALLKAGGSKYKKERQKLIDKIPSFKLKGPVYYSSPGGDLKFKHVFHAVTVNRSNRGASQKNDLKHVYNMLGKMADGQEIKKIVTPLLGTGHEGRPMEESLQAIVDGLSRMKLKSLREVIIVEFKEEKVSEIRDKLRDILEAAAKGEQGPRQAGGGAWKSPSSAAAAAPASSGGQPPGRFRQGQMHGGSGSDPNKPSQISQSPAGKGSSASQDTVPKDIAGREYPVGIVQKHRDKYEAGSQNATTPHGPGTSRLKTYAEAAAPDNSRKSGQPRGSEASPSTNSGHKGKQGDLGRGRSRGRGDKKEGLHQDHGDSYKYDNPCVPAAPSAGEGEPKEPDASPDNAGPKETLNIVMIHKAEDSGDEEEDSGNEEEDSGDEEEDSGDEEGTDDDKNEGYAAEAGNWRGQSEWSAEMYGSDGKDKSTENGKPSRRDHPPRQPEQVQTWSSSSLPGSQNQPPNPHTNADKSPRLHHPGAQISRRNGDEDDEDDDNDDDGNGSPNTPRRPNHNNHPCNDDDDDDDEEEENAGIDSSAHGYDYNDESPSAARRRQGTDDEEDDKVNEGSSVGRDVWSQRPSEEDTTWTEEGKPQASHDAGGVGEAEGKMVVTKKPDLTLAGFSNRGTILVEYSFPNGIQGPQHPAPGQPYKGTFRRAFLPDNQEGRCVLQLLQTAFDRKLIFHLERSGPGQEWGVEFARIPHKTSLRGGPEGHGYPDDNYLSTVTTILASLGIK